MPTVREIKRFLEQIEELTDHIAADSAQLDLNVYGVSADTAAGFGELAWISPKNAERDPKRIAAFRGTALIASASTPTMMRPVAGVILRCRTPKLAFTRVVGRFFGTLTEIAWPQSGASAVASDASLGSDVRLAPGVVIGSGVSLGDRVTVGPNTCLANVSVSCDVVIGANCTIGLPGFGYEKDAQGRYWRFPHVGRIDIGEVVEIGSNVCIDRGALGVTTIKAGAKIDNLVHIAHNVVVGENSLVIANSMIGGSTQIGPRAWLAPSVSILNQVTIGADAVVGMGAVVLKNVEDGAVVVGNPARPIKRGTPK